MGHYVYQYLHPIYGHLYCGRTCDLDKRIYTHNNCKNDNIPNKYKKLLKESVIMYVELSNKAQEIAVEAYCIDKFKPFLNKALKYDGKEAVIEMTLPQWKVYDPKISEYKHQLSVAVSEQDKLTKDISDIDNNIINQRENLSKMKLELKKINYEIAIRDSVDLDNSLFGFTISDIEWFYKYCRNKDVIFTSTVYDLRGTMTNKGIVFYDNGKQTTALKRFEGSNFSESRTLSQEEPIFHILCASLYNFYPDVNIYPELYATLLSKKDEWAIKNQAYDLKDLFCKFNEGYCDSIDDKIRIRFENEKLTYCAILDTYKCVNYPDGRYFWDCDDNTNIDPEMERYIFSSKYYSPDKNSKEEEYINEMLCKMSKMIKAA